MDYWAPIFSKIVDSSIWCEPDHVRLVWISMLAKKDKDQVVRATAFMIAQWARKTEAEVLDALRILSSPDTKRLELQPFDGRRIERVKDGWLILNGQRYHDAMKKAERNLYQAEWQRDYRAEKKELEEAQAAAAKAKRVRRPKVNKEGVYSENQHEAVKERLVEKWEAGEQAAEAAAAAKRGVIQQPGVVGDDLSGHQSSL